LSLSSSSPSTSYSSSCGHIQLEKVDLSRLAFHSEGYCPDDLKQIVSRAVHAAITRQVETTVASKMAKAMTVKGDGRSKEKRRQKKQQEKEKEQAFEFKSPYDMWSNVWDEEEETKEERNSAGDEVNFNNDLDDDSEDEGEEEDADQVINAVWSAPTSACATDSCLLPLSSASPAPLVLTQADFTQAFDGFVPSSLKELPLASSSTNWREIGGLYEAKATLKETLELPTKFARLFEKVPLKLRSGLMLYGPPVAGACRLWQDNAGVCRGQRVRPELHQCQGSRVAQQVHRCQ